ncbi:hypothetical protein FOE78_13030 [Microlunatus elymi]|uniref:HTH luxR-type domain-containing protein n=1 Tax=Microlunatus elymi TaxID=2596828 RepID=A0A516PZV1_9ACTN|nr:LuxR C-terminal-related transcriptional regulator [Microlunatus elymi]QDP96709.1 hypothetical protein FOE78_13030 [Microlunatus elymi]
MSRADGSAGGRLSPPPAVKITPPQLPAAQVPRERLLAGLNGAGEDTVVLLSAPAGSGKTQLLAEWAGSRTGPTAWVKVDRADNDEQRFWSAVVSALRSCAPVPTAVPLPRSGVAPSRSLDVTYVTAIAESIAGEQSPQAADTTPVTLILDDIGELTDPAPLQGLDDLITYAGPQIRLVLSGRIDPALRFGPLRLDDRLLALRGPDLAFTRPETELLLAHSGLNLTDDQVRLLIEQTGGWAAGLRLAVLAMRRSEPAAVLTDLIGSTKTISDYLVGEVLSGLSPRARRLLDRTAVCTRITAGLAGCLTDLPDAGEVLAELESTNSLVTSHGGGRRWFQVHPLLRAHLLMDLRRLHPDLESELHADAAGWFEQQDQPDDALRHAIAGGDPALVAALVERHGIRLLLSGQHALLRSAAGAFTQLFRTDPRSALLLAAAQLDVARADSARHSVEAAAAGWPDRPDPTLADLWQLVNGRLVLAGEHRVAIDHPLSPRLVAASRAASADPADPDAEALNVLARATVAAAEGAADRCRELAETVVALGRGVGNGYLTARGLALLAIASAQGGDLASVATLSDRVGSAADPKLWRGTADDVLMHVFRAQAALAGGQPDRCQELLARLRPQAGAAGGPATPHPVTGWIRLLSATADHDLGNRARALERLAALRSGLGTEHAPPALIAAHAMIEHDAALQLNHTGRAREVIAWAEEALGPVPDLRLLRARSSAKISRFTSARADLGPLLNGSAQPLMLSALVDGWVLETWIRLRCGERERAIDGLAAALDEATRSAALRPLLRAPAVVLALLAEQLGSWGANEQTARTVLARRQTTDEVTVSLTERERQVLNRLQSMRSLEEIAGDLTVSLNTVKTHVRSIYGKLGVGSRREAIQAGRSQGLL